MDLERESERFVSDSVLNVLILLLGDGVVVDLLFVSRKLEPRKFIERRRVKLLAVKADIRAVRFRARGGSGLARGHIFDRAGELGDTVGKRCVDIPTARHRQSANLRQLAVGRKFDTIDRFDQLVVASLKTLVLLNIQR